MEYAQALKKRAVVKEEEAKDVLILTFHNGEVQYRMNKTPALEEKLKREAEAESSKNSLAARMQKAVNDISDRQAAYKKKDLEDYGYDHYLQDYSYKCPSDSDSDAEPED